MGNGIDLNTALNVAADRLRSDLRKLDIDGLPVSDYNKNYLHKHLKTLDYVFDIYIFTLTRCLENSSRPYHETCLVDYGAGTGLMALLAKKAGIGTVIYNDIYDVSCRDARIISSALNVDLDHYIEGDVDVLARVCMENRLLPDCMVSMDVLEHIYDLDRFLKSASTLSESLVMVHTTGANIENPRIRRNLMEVQRVNELEGFEYTPGYKERDSLLPYLEIRKQLISSNFPALKSDEVNMLARLTRGKVKEDILREAGIYANDGTTPTEISHPTNTCDPLTGNWAERLLTLKEYQELSARNGFGLERFCGFYNRYTSNPVKKAIIGVLNLILDAGGKRMAPLAPFISLKFSKKNPHAH